jgi:hypothetical protein
MILLKEMVCRVSKVNGICGKLILWRAEMNVFLCLADFLFLSKIFGNKNVSNMVQTARK